MKNPICIILTLSILLMGCSNSESGKEVSEEKEVSSTSETQKCPKDTIIKYIDKAEMILELRRDSHIVYMIDSSRHCFSVTFKGGGSCLLFYDKDFHGLLNIDNRSSMPESEIEHLWAKVFQGFKKSNLESVRFEDDNHKIYFFFHHKITLVNTDSSVSVPNFKKFNENWYFLCQ